jgi:phage baseplate assembly protein gpV
MASSLALHRGLVVSIEDPLQQGRLQIQNLASGEQLWATVNTISLGAMEIKAIYSIGDEVMYLADDSTTDALVIHRQKPATCAAEQQNSPLKIALNAENEITLTFEDNALTLATNFGQQVSLSADGEIKISASSISVKTGLFNLDASIFQVNAGGTHIMGMLNCQHLTTSTIVTGSIASKKYIR